jgi:hypothetical protein
VGLGIEAQAPGQSHDLRPAPARKLADLYLKFQDLRHEKLLVAKHRIPPLQN